MIPVIEASAREDRHHASRRGSSTTRTALIFVPKEKVPFTGTAGWGKDYPDAFTYFLYLFDGRSITPEFSYNEPLVGLTEEQAGKIGVDYPAEGVPSVDAGHRRVHRDRLTRPSASTCWGDARQEAHGGGRPVGSVHLARTTTTIIAPSVTQWVFDQATGQPAPGCTSRSTRRSSRRDSSVVRRRAAPLGAALRVRPAVRAEERGMGAYIVRRLIWAVFVVLIVTLITYFIFFIMPPGDPDASLRRQVADAGDARRRSASGSGSTEPGTSSTATFVKQRLHRRRVGLARPRLLLRHPGLRA